MTAHLTVRRAGPAMTVQDPGRAGRLAFGLSRGGAADLLALAEGAALLGQGAALGALEMGAMGGDFDASADVRIALVGAPMPASIDGAAIAWNASHLLPRGARLSIGAARTGVYGYLHLGGGLAPPQILGARSAHLAAGIGRPVQQGDVLPLGPDAGKQVGRRITPTDRFDGGTVRIVPSVQTEFFDPDQVSRFERTRFTRDARGNRMGVRIVPDGPGFHTEAGLSVLSEAIVPGDVQITGDGTPFVLLCECQTTGGYPRIGSVLPLDLPRVAQAAAGASLRFQFVSLAQAVDLERQEAARRAALRGSVAALIRSPHDIPDLLSYQLIGGVTAGDDLDRAPW